MSRALRWPKPSPYAVTAVVGSLPATSWTRSSGRRHLPIHASDTMVLGRVGLKSATLRACWLAT